MASTRDKVQKTLSEVRTLVLGAQILFGFQYQAIFRPRFENLPPYAKLLEAMVFTVMLAIIVLLIAPSPFHRICEKGEATRRQLTYTKIMAGMALVLFAPAIGANVTMTVSIYLGTSLAVLLGVTMAALAAWFWFGIALMRRSIRPGDHSLNMQDRDEEKVPLREKINELLTEARIVLPGAQALLGFQFAAYLTESFEKLSPAAKAVHTGSLFLIALSMILLMSPAPYHRLAENGENTEHFDRIGVRFVLGALVPLGFGLAGDLYIVLEKVSGRSELAILGAVALVIGAFLLWFALPLVARRRSGGAR
jgi:hypothetical protein